MPIESRQVAPGIALVVISGRLVLGKDIERLETATKDLIQEGERKFVFDISAMEYADSSGVGTLVSCLTEIKKAGGELRVAGANPRIQRLLTLTGIHSMLSLYSTVAEASAG
jgi:anti-anti-sigma factor